MRFALIALVAAGLSLLSPSAAEAGAKSAYKVDYCSSGSYQGVGTNQLTNGTLRMGWCKSKDQIRTVTVRYDKYSGSRATIRLGYRTANRDASNVGPVHWDPSSYDWGTISTGQSWSYRTSPARDLLAARQCVQGVLNNGSRNYYSHTVC